MGLIPLSVFAVVLLTSVSCERHSLTYIYTALSRPVSNPGIHEFTAMGLLNHNMIDYFDSDLQKKVPKKAWMSENLSADYWTKGTESRKSKQQWFKVNLDILKERMNQTDEDVHVLQWMHGCEAKSVPDDSAPSGYRLDFQRGIDQYSYNGDSFLYFDDANGIWVAAASAAEPTKRKWDDVQVLKDYTKGYLEKECLDWLGKFMEYGKLERERAVEPDVYMFARPSKRNKDSVVLTCMATGFYPPEIMLHITRNGRILTMDDGVTTTGPRPNEDETFQRRDSIEILRSDTAHYICEVFHPATGKRHEEPWDGVLPEMEDDVGGVPVGAVVGGVVGGVAALLLLVGGVIMGRGLYFKRYYHGEYRMSELKDDSDGSSSSNDSINKDDQKKTSSTSSTDSGVVCAEVCMEWRELNVDSVGLSSSSSSSSPSSSNDSIDKASQKKTSSSDSDIGKSMESSSLKENSDGSSSNDSIDKNNQKETLSTSSTDSVIDTAGESTPLIKGGSAESV